MFAALAVACGQDTRDSDNPLVTSENSNRSSVIQLDGTPESDPNRLPAPAAPQAQPVAQGAPSAIQKAEATVPGTRTDANKLSIPELVQIARASIVHIATEQSSTRSTDSTYPDGGVATGFILESDGLIVTNNHVVAGTQRILATLPSSTTLEATVVGRDPQTDLAVLSVKATGLTPITLGRSSELRIGEPVIAIGHALDLPGGPTVTMGVVSAVDRTITNIGRQRLTLTDLIQTDASINPGNSGGPLLNQRGEVVGVNMAGLGGSTGISFAISIDSAIPIIKQLVNEGHIVRGFLGIVPVAITRGIARQTNLPVNTGIVIAGISMDSPAMRGGLLRGDIVVTINDEEIPNVGVLTRVLAKYAPGTEVTIQVLRPGVNNGQRLSAKVTLSKRPDQ